jgi:heptosyltransferase-2
VEILLLHPGGLGDIILSLPAIALLRSTFPSAKFAMAGNIDHLATIVSGYAERVLSLSSVPLHHLYIGEPLPQAEVHFWKSFDRIVSWTGSGDSEFVRRMKEIRPDACIAPWRPGPEEPRHVSQLFVDSLGLPISAGKGLTPARILPGFLARDEGLQWLAERGWNGRDPLIALHPGAGSKAKRWPLSRFISLVRQLTLQEKGELLIIEGPAEPGLARQIAQALPDTEMITIESVPLDLLAGVMEKCKVFVGSDSGLAHLAAALEVPTIVLFGPTLPQHWAPLGRKVSVLRDTRGCEACISGRGDHGCLSNLAVEQVIRSIHCMITP